MLLITGASRGIGAATALLAASSGHSVCINYNRSADEAQRLVRTIRERGGEAIAVQADVSVEADVCRLFESIDKAGELSGLVNNAGILEQQARFADIDTARWLRILHTNVLSCALCSREAVRRMSTAAGGRGGAIVNVSSIAARTGSPFEYVDYAASKGAIDSMTTGMAKELAAEGIRVNGVRPALIETSIHASGGEPGRVGRLRNNIPMRRGGRPEEVAEAILWLLSDQSSFTTGSFIEVSGGL